MQPLDGIKALEFGGTILVTLLALVLAEAGADKVKVEPRALSLCARAPQPGGEKLEFGLLKRGKRRVVANFAD